MSKTQQSVKVNNTINSLVFEREIQAKVNAIVYNEKLIEFMRSTIEAQKKINDKLYLLYLFKRVFATSNRTPDKKHFYFFENEYLLDRDTFDVNKWLKVEIEFYKNIQSLELQVPYQGISEAKAELSKQWLIGEEVESMFGWSRTTLNRRIAEGMPFHAKGKTKFFNLEEVGEWIRKVEQ